MRRSYLKEHHPVLYADLLASGTLHRHLAEIDQACNERMAIIVSNMAKQEGVAEALKAADQMEWVRRMNSIRDRAAEVVPVSYTHLDVYKRQGQSEASTAPPTAFHLPLHNRTADRAIQYLTESRGLNKTLVEAFLLSGDIYEDAKRHNVVFVGRDRSGTPRYAHVRGTADPFRQDITGSDKSYPFRYEGNGNQLFVFEAPIDLLSFICLYPQDWQTRSYLALGGVSGKALDRFLSEHKDILKVFLCLDSDTAGSEACSRLVQDIPGEIAVIRLVPVRKDWNDVLR